MFTWPPLNHMYRAMEIYRCGKLASLNRTSHILVKSCMHRPNGVPSKYGWLGFGLNFLTTVLTTAMVGINRSASTIVRPWMRLNAEGLCFLISMFNWRYLSLFPRAIIAAFSWTRVNVYSPNCKYFLGYRWACGHARKTYIISSVPALRRTTPPLRKTLISSEHSCPGQW